LAPLSFDASTFEVWGSLLNGGRLAVCAPGVPTLAELEEVIEREGVTTLWLTAGLFHLLVDERVGALSGVRQLVAGGDVVSARHAREYLKAATERQSVGGGGEGVAGGGEVRLVNGYGPTESTTFACCHVMAGVAEVGAVVPIGRPIGNTQAYVLDERMGLVAAGVTGELYLGGDGLARGYLNEAGLTAVRFVPHPYAAEGGERLYRTGDLVRYRANGDIEFIGRADQQVKVRGFRIELGEIEATVTQLSEVNEAVVVARGDDAGNKVLVCYVVMPDRDAQHVNRVREYLKERLPDYMVPSSFVLLSEMPLTPNGKVDRGALPDPDQSRPELIASYVAPRNQTEETLALMWAEVLKVERVGVEDNFFDLGGHSLLATQIISRVRETFKVEVPLRNLFESPTVAALAELLDKAENLLEPQAPEIVPVTRHARRVKRPRTDAQK
jgi:aspartate racemase